jgi:hypothetical protein
MLGTITPEQMHAAAVATGVAMAVWLGVGAVPALRPYARVIKGAVLLLYLGTFAGAALWLLLR